MPQVLLNGYVPSGWTIDCGYFTDSSIQSGGKKTVNSQPVVDIPSVNFFNQKYLQVQIQELNYESILPTGLVREGSEIVFNIRGDVERFIDPSSVRLRIVVELRNDDGTQLTPEQNCAPIANFGGSLFSRVIVTLGNTTQITSSNGLYGYLAYLCMVLASSKEYKEVHNFVSLIYRDTAGVFDMATDANEGYKERKTQSAVSEPINVIVPIISPITNQSRLIIPNVDLSFNLQPNTNAFLIRSDQTNQKVVIRSIEMEYKKVRLNTEFHLNIMAAIARTPALYPVKFQQMFEFSRQIGVRTIRESIFTDRLLPSTVFLMVVPTDHRIGSYATTPWLIATTNISEVKLISGSDTYPNLPYSPRIRKVNYMYLEAKKCLGSFDQPGSDNGIPIGDYMSGYGIIAFDLSRSGMPSIPDVPRIGDLQLHIDYSENLAEPTTFILIMEYHSKIYMSNSLDITTEFIP